MTLFFPQTELGNLLGMSRERVDYYERRAKNPALEVVQTCAKVLDVSASYLVGADDEPMPKKKRTGPASQLQRKVEQVKLLPREKQKFVLQFLDTVLDNQQKQKA